MIGQVDFAGGTATLGDDGRWRCFDRAVEKLLNALHSIRDYSPADGQPGHRQLHEAAERLQGTVTLAPVPPTPADAIF